MDAELKAKWIAALRGGGYIQGYNRLVTVFPLKKEHCCLGVLCDILGLETETDSEGDVYYIYKDSADNHTLPSPMVDDFDLSISRLNELMVMNDSRKPFPEIADFIEENL